MYVCKRCGYESEYKHCLQNHFKRKVPCQVTKEDISIDVLLNEMAESKQYSSKTYDCEYCGKKFNKCSNKSRHKKICKEKPRDTETIVHDLSEQVKKLQSQIEDLHASKVQNISSNNTSNSSTTNNTCNTSNNTNNTQNININLPNNFGRENMAAIPESLISTLFMNLRFRELLANLHCDPNFPENQNVRIRSVKRNTMEIFRNNKWDIMTFTSGLTELLLQGHKIFKDYYNKDKERILEEDMSEEDIGIVLNQLEQIESLNKNELRPLLAELQLMLEEYREHGHAIVLS